ncbi:general secretion pathway protein M [Alcanivorax xiamenensis]|uniref:Type II secretion system protein M n=1 Tax=Alcanivorax xiamenensis TaxID=1177156 RepID=A0ABQ6Y9J2_9GAMM|nr:type II secretion system protein M [Alcanivorax xiamenensis]KAF0806371.1 general secretion pathway protein M [Alcanivorax xiamenensis]
MKQHIEQARTQMNKRLQPAFEWYASREPREQTILQLLGAVVVLFLIYWLIWQPVWNARESARQRYVANEQTRQWIELNAPAVRAARGQNDNRDKSSAFGDNWVSEISRSAQNHGLTLQGFTPDGNRSVRIQLEDQPANAVLIWLHFLEDQGLNLGTLELGPGNESGTATLRASLSR